MKGTSEGGTSEPAPKYQRLQGRGRVRKKLEEKGMCGGVLKSKSGERIDERRETRRQYATGFFSALQGEYETWSVNC